MEVWIFIIGAAWGYLACDWIVAESRLRLLEEVQSELKQLRKIIDSERDKVTK